MLDISCEGRNKTHTEKRIFRKDTEVLRKLNAEQRAPRGENQKAMDRKLIIGTLILLFIQICLLVADVDVFFLTNGVENETAPAQKIGLLINKKQNVKRRSHGSIVWEDSQESDNLMIYDSVLTLENSSAQLKLKDDVQINLHENTLIVLEPSEHDKNDSLRIRFNYGDFSSQNRKQRMQVGSGEFLIDAKPGTNLNLKSIAGDKVEVEISSGAIDIIKKNSPQEVKTIENGTRFTIDKNTITDTQKISDSLKFSMRAEERIYTHEFPIQFRLRWQGDAKEIRIVGPDKKPFYINVKNEKEHALELTQGSHYLTLINDTQISSEVALRVLQAPRIRYTAPLPRDRFELGSHILFSWLPAEGALKYEVELTNPLGERERLPAQINIHEGAPQIEGPVQMRVWAEDEAGFKIPPHYKLQLYFIRDPFAPPKLIVPPKNAAPNSDDQSFIPKKSGAHWLYSLIFGELAQADEPSTQKTKIVRKIIFGWEPIQGADFYNIEISSEKDFAKPEVMRTVKENSFHWSEYSKQTYYWRVAAGADSGRMGLFSEAATVNLSKVDSLKEGEISPGVLLVITEIHEPPPVQTILSSPPDTTAPATLPAPLATQESNKWQHTLALNLQHLNYSFKGDVSATLTGFANFSFTEESHCIFNDQSTLTFFGHYAKITWGAEKESELPFQSKLSTSEYSGTVLYSKFGREISYGLHITNLTTLKRVALEAVKDQSSILFGPAFGYNTTINKELAHHSHVAIIYGDQIGGAKSENQLNYNINNYVLGGDIDFAIFFGDQSLSGFYLKSGLHFGYTW